MRATDSPRRVLVIDDNRAVHETLRRILGGADELQLDTIEALLFGDAPPDVQLCDFEICSAYQGDEGVQLARDAIANGAPFDVAFIDMRMPPGCDGIETIELLWEVDPACPVVLLASSSEHPWSELVRRLGQNDQWVLLKKPLEQAEVAQAATAMAVKRRKQSAAQLRNIELQHVIDEQTVELRRSAEEAERLLNAISSMLVGIDRDGRVTRWNGAATKAFEIPASRAVGRSFLDLPIRWTSRDQLQLILSGEFRDRQELTFEDRQSQLHILGVTVCPVRPHGGVLLVARDITELRVAEQRLSQNRRMEAIGQLAAGIAHEINTPVQHIGEKLKFAAQMLNRILPLLAKFDDVVESLKTTNATLAAEVSAVNRRDIQKVLTALPEALEGSADGVQQVASIVQGLQEFSHPHQQQRTSVDINQSLETTIAVARNEWKHVAEIHREFDQDLPPAAIYGGEMNQVFLNLLTNAAHSISAKTKRGAEGKGAIRIRTKCESEMVEVQIEDDGSGMPPEAREHAFQPFFTTKPVGQGTGQGLALAKKIVEEQHGGKIWFEFEEDRGTCFFIQLPTTPEANRAVRVLEGTV